MEESCTGNRFADLCLLGNLKNDLGVLRREKHSDGESTQLPVLFPYGAVRQRPESCPTEDPGAVPLDKSGHGLPDSRCGCLRQGKDAESFSFRFQTQSLSQTIAATDVDFPARRHARRHPNLPVNRGNHVHISHCIGIDHSDTPVINGIDISF
ncbi:hypothetical protein PoB_001329000 [Plakobranchus ocellatus]|uniref:Uncharacterized protein n=1 Tax=Plakobranchus ocellatus TaxID=259542 RepID=A0AAV3YWE3_9GAST|nr:hypothetical protein PoB_001329000 [Plakobranchus ocellatus]